jgi:predicted Fe-Mo cluster-binding NifX family protein
MEFLKHKETKFLERTIMKICITAKGPDLNSEVDSRFGRCSYFIIIDPEKMDFESIENPNIHAVGGVGIRSAQFISNKAVNTVITGNCGPNAFYTLKSANIDIVTGAKGIVKEMVEKYKDGSLKSDSGPSVSQKFGL